MTLPATESEIAQARRTADELVDELLTKDLLGIGVPPLHPDAGQIDACAKLKKLFEGDPCYRVVVLNAALNGYMPARMALGELVQEVDEDKQPSELRTFAKACANPHHRWPAKPAAKRYENVKSDTAVVMLLLRLSELFPRIDLSSPDYA